MPAGPRPSRTRPSPEPAPQVTQRILRPARQARSSSAPVMLSHTFRYPEPGVQRHREHEAHPTRDGSTRTRFCTAPVISSTSSTNSNGRYRGQLTQMTRSTDARSASGTPVESGYLWPSFWTLRLPARGPYGCPRGRAGRHLLLAVLLPQGRRGSGVRGRTAGPSRTARCAAPLKPGKAARYPQRGPPREPSSLRQAAMPSTPPQPHRGDRDNLPEILPPEPPEGSVRRTEWLCCQPGHYRHRAPRDYLTPWML
jgi:hypothetical protein